MPNITTTTLRLDEPDYNPEFQTWYYPIFDTESGRTVGRGEVSQERTVAQINAQRQLEKIARLRESERTAGLTHSQAAFAYVEGLFYLGLMWIVLILAWLAVKSSHDLRTAKTFATPAPITPRVVGFHNQPLNLREGGSL